jgi:hypothetical protein
MSIPASRCGAPIVLTRFLLVLARLVRNENGTELVANGAETIRGYDPMTGKELWKLKGTSMISVPTPFIAHDLIFVFTGYSRFIQPIYAIKPGARGDITPPKDATSTDQIAWTMQKGAPYLSTPVVSMATIYMWCSAAAS